ncbi:hypothetical protein OK074_0138 [Actinobacteria bacterium OK074]|nr:hypothetical protein OK074_0138 [Actinobacteria bacterium OK074]
MIDAGLGLSAEEEEFAPVPVTLPEESANGARVREPSREHGFHAISA